MLTWRFQDYYNLLQDKLDSALVETCRVFDQLRYERILIAYRLMGQSHTVVEKLRLYFLETVNSNTKNIINAHVLMSEENAMKIEALKRYS